MDVNSKHSKTLAAIFARPTASSIVFADIEALVNSLGGSVIEREGSRVKIVLAGFDWAIGRIQVKRPNAIKSKKRVIYFSEQE